MRLPSSPLTPPQSPAEQQPGDKASAAPTLCAHRAVSQQIPSVVSFFTPGAKNIGVSVKNSNELCRELTTKCLILIRADSPASRVQVKRYSSEGKAEWRELRWVTEGRSREDEHRESLTYPWIYPATHGLAGSPGTTCPARPRRGFGGAGGFFRGCTAQAKETLDCIKAAGGGGASTGFALL